MCAPIYDLQSNITIVPKHIMVPVLDGNSEHFAHARRKIGLFESKNPIKCLK